MNRRAILILTLAAFVLATTASAQSWRREFREEEKLSEPRIREEREPRVREEREPRIRQHADRVVLGLRGFVIDDEAYEIAGLRVVSHGGSTIEGENGDVMGGVFRIADQAWLVKNVTATWRDASRRAIESLTAEIHSMPGDRPLRAAVPARVGSRGREESERLGSLQLSIDAKRFAQTITPCAKGTATIDGVTWTLVGTVTMRPRGGTRLMMNDPVTQDYDDDDEAPYEDDQETIDENDADPGSKESPDAAGTVYEGF